MDGVKEKVYFGTTEVWLRRDTGGEACAYTGDECVVAAEPLQEVAFDTPEGHWVAVLPSVPGRAEELWNAGGAGLPAPLECPLVKAPRGAAGADVCGAGGLPRAWCGSRAAGTTRTASLHVWWTLRSTPRAQTAARWWRCAGAASLRRVRASCG